MASSSSEKKPPSPSFHSPGGHFVQSLAANIFSHLPFSPPRATSSPPPPPQPAVTVPFFLPLPSPSTSFYNNREEPSASASAASSPAIRSLATSVRMEGLSSRSKGGGVCQPAFVGQVFSMLDPSGVQSLSLRRRMAVPTDLVARGCSAHLAQPVGEEGLMEADELVQAMYQYNGPGVVFRTSYNEEDIHRHVFRWSSLEPEQVFINGFQADAQGDTPDSTYYNLHDYVYNAGSPMNPHRNNYIFVSTTLNSGYVPQTSSYRDREVWRYEIYAPGGIWVALTLANYRYQAQDEVAFVRGINRQYIRSAQRFRLVESGGGHLRRERVDQVLVMNPYIDPASHPERRLITIHNAVDYCMINNRRVPLNITYTDPQPLRKKRDVSTPDDGTFTGPSGTTIWYGEKVTNTDSNINAGFRSYYTNEAYLFMRNEYILIDYAPGGTNDKILNGPLLIRDGFPSLAKTAFAEHGIDCSFGSYDSKEAYIFTGNLCARINFAPRSTDDRIIKGPVTIAEMFPFFKGTGFENGVDAAFEYSADYEAYIFKGDRYALINYKQPRLIGGPKKITDGYHSLRGTIFESGIEAAFASHTKKEAYLFKGDQYALINFAPGGTDDYIINGPKKITPSWPSLATVLPHKNHGLD